MMERPDEVEPQATEEYLEFLGRNGLSAGRASHLPAEHRALTCIAGASRRAFLLLSNGYKGELSATEAAWIKQEASLSYHIHNRFKHIYRPLPVTIHDLQIRFGLLLLFPSSPTSLLA